MFDSNFALLAAAFMMMFLILVLAIAHAKLKGNVEWLKADLRREVENRRMLRQQVWDLYAMHSSMADALGLSYREYTVKEYVRKGAQEPPVGVAGAGGGVGRPVGPRSNGGDGGPY